MSERGMEFGSESYGDVFGDASAELENAPIFELTEDDVYRAIRGEIDAKDFGEMAEAQGIDFSIPSKIIIEGENGSPERLFSSPAEILTHLRDERMN